MFVNLLFITRFIIIVFLLFGRHFAMLRTIKICIPFHYSNFTIELAASDEFDSLANEWFEFEINAAAERKLYASFGKRIQIKLFARFSNSVICIRHGAALFVLYTFKQILVFAR